MMCVDVYMYDVCINMYMHDMCLSVYMYDTCAYMMRVYGYVLCVYKCVHI